MGAFRRRLANVAAPGGIVFTADNSGFAGAITTASGATLEATSPAALPGGSGSVSVESGGTLAVVPGSGNWSQTAIDALTASGCLQGGANLGIDTQGGTVNYDDSNLSSSLGLVVFGGGTAVLSGTNSHLPGLYVSAPPCRSLPSMPWPPAPRR